MKITARIEIDTRLYKEHPEAVKHDLRMSVCDELVKHEQFIEPAVRYRNNKTEVDIILYALDYNDIDRLEELSVKYPEIREILFNIIVEK